ncbi:MAG TPA: hypothetical protein VF209_05430, partial [Patescibacteria group bacterium]
MTLKLASLLTGLFFIAAAFFAPPTLAQDLCVRPTDPGCFRDPDTGQFIRDDGFRGSIPEINEFKESVEQNNREGKVSIGNTVGNNVLESTFAGVYCGLTDSQSCPRKPNSVAFTTSMSRMIA